MELSNLPDEKIYEICESMDIKTLFQFVQTNWKMYGICSKIIGKKLTNELVGTWFTYGPLPEYPNLPQISSIEVELIDKNLKVNQPFGYEPILENMIDKSFQRRTKVYEFRTKIVPVEDISQLRYLYINLIKLGYIPIHKNGDFLGYNSDQWKGIIIKEKRDITVYKIGDIPFGIIKLIYQKLNLNIPNDWSNFSNDDMPFKYITDFPGYYWNLIFEELDRIGRLIKV